MSYGVGKIGAFDGMALIAMLSLPMIYFLEPSIAIGFTGSAAWLMKLVSCLIVFVVISSKLYWYRQYSCQLSADGMVEYDRFIQGLIGKNGACIFFCVWAVLFEIKTALLLRELANHTVLTTMPSSSVSWLTLLFGICMLILLQQGLEVLLRGACIFFLVSAAGIGFMIVSLWGEGDTIRMLPLAGNGVGALIKYSLLDCGSWAFTGAVFLVLPNLQRIAVFKKAVRYGIGMSALFKILLLAVFVMVFGQVMASERTQLFYEAVRTIQLSEYIQRLDAVFVLIWLTGGLISITLMQYISVEMFCRAFALKDMRPLLPAAVLISLAGALLTTGFMKSILINELVIYYGAAAVIFTDALLINGAGMFRLWRKHNAENI